MSLQLILKAFYSVMAVGVLSMMWFYSRGLAGDGKGWMARFKIPFYGWIGALVVVGIVFHLLTAMYIPWVRWEVKRNKITPEREIFISIKESQFKFPDEGMSISKGELVRFKVLSGDLTYGFGVFRENGTMVFQMQVVPGHSNELIWAFSESGNYTVRSTEYAGPDTYKMLAKNAVEVLPEMKVMAGKTQKGEAWFQ